MAVRARGGSCRARLYAVRAYEHDGKESGAALRILRLAIAVTERTGLRVLFEWSGPFDGVHVRYYLPGEQRPCVRDVWFDQADPGEAARQLEGIRDFLGRLSGVPGNA